MPEASGVSSGLEGGGPAGRRIHRSVPAKMNASSPVLQVRAGEA